MATMADLIPLQPQETEKSGVDWFSDPVHDQQRPRWAPLPRDFLADQSCLPIIESSFISSSPLVY